MAKVTNELIYEVLKDIQTRVSQVESNVRDLVKGQIAIRKDINGLESHSLRHEGNLVELNERLDRIERSRSHIDA